MLKFTVTICVVVAIFYGLGATAWWDEGHMIIGRIARNSMSSEEINKIESYLKLWENPYKGFSEIDFAAVWADHLKCGSNSYYCGGLHFYDEFEAFNEWHYVDKVYNPNSIPLSPLALSQPHQKTGGAFILHKFWTTVKAGIYHPCDSDSCPRRIGSSFTWNMILRFLIHIFGDLHQPLHSMEGYSETFKNGDHGGNAIHLAMHGVGNLHEYFDSGIMNYKKNWPHISATQLDTIAQELVKKYPDAYDPTDDIFKPEKMNIDVIVTESYRHGVQIYKKINFKDILPSTNNITVDQQTSDDWLTLCENRFVVAGKRLGLVLSFLATALPTLPPADSLAEAQSTHSTGIMIIAIGISLSILILLFICGSLVYSYRHRILPIFKVPNMLKTYRRVEDHGEV